MAPDPKALLPTPEQLRNALSGNPRPEASASARSEAVPEDADMSHNLGHEDALKIIDAITSAPDDPDQIKAAWEKNLPDGAAISFKQLQFALHPDKFQQLQEKEQAQKAFQKLSQSRDQSGKFHPGTANRETNFYHGGPRNNPQQHVEGQILSYHIEAHERATPHLSALFQALQKAPNATPRAQNAPPDMVKAYDEIDAINTKIRNDNKLGNKDIDLGIVRADKFLTMWGPLFRPEGEMLKPTQMMALQEFCRQFHYPNGWANLPPSGQNYLTNPTDQFQPESTAQASTSVSQNSIQLRNASAGGQVRAISIRPRTTARSIKPGFTSSGERITMVQLLGLSSARFVVEDAQGGIRLVSSAASGGSPALEGALKAKIQETLRKEEDIRVLRDRVRAGGTYGLKFVAVGEWDSRKDRLPFIVVGFYHEGDNAPLREEGLSRSALRKILAPREADRLIAENMVSNPSIPLKDALRMLSPAQPESLPMQQPYLGLSDREQNSYPWLASVPYQMLQTAPSHHPVFAQHFQPSPAAQQPFPSQFQQQPAFAQQFQPSQTQHPFPAQFQQFPSHIGFQSPYAQYPQPIPFSAPPQPIMDISKQAPAFDSNMSVTEEEL